MVALIVLFTSGKQKSLSKPVGKIGMAEPAVQESFVIAPQSW